MLELRRPGQSVQWPHVKGRTMDVSIIALATLGVATVSLVVQLAQLMRDSGEKEQD